MPLCQDQGRRSQLCSQKPVKVIEECVGRLTDHCEEALFGIYRRQSYLALHGIVGTDPEVPPPWNIVFAIGYSN